MSKRNLLVLLLLLPCVCKAEELIDPETSRSYGYHDRFHFFVEQTGHNNYNFRLGDGFTNRHIEEGYYYSFDWFYFRIIEDENTWRFSTPIILSIISTMGMWGSVPRARPITLFDPGWGLPAVISSMPLMLMNPTVGLLTKTWEIGVGYNTDFITTFSDRGPPFYIYFAPKIKLGWVITEHHFWKKILLSAILSYQVFDCFATKRGFHLGLSLAVLE